MIREHLVSLLPRYESKRSRIIRTVGCDLLGNKGELHPMFYLRFTGTYNTSECVTLRLTYTIRCIRACDLVRSSLPYVSGSSVHENGPDYRGRFNRTATLLTNSTLLARTFRVVTISGVSSRGGTLTIRLLSRGDNIRKVLNKRIVSLGCRDRSPALGRLLSIRELGANTLVSTTYLLKYVTTNTSSIRVSTTSHFTCGLNVTFRVGSSVLSIINSDGVLNGPINSSTTGSGMACISLINLSGTRRSIRALASGTIGYLNIFRGASFLRLLTSGLIGQGGWLLQRVF